MQDASSKQQAKQKYKPSHQQIGSPPTQPCPSEEKQTNKQAKTQHKSYPIEAYTNHWTNRRRAETKRKKEFNLLQRKYSTFLEAWGKDTSNTIS